MAIAPGGMTAQPRLFRRTPPAVFPSIMGLMGLGLGWRRGADAFGLPQGLAEALLGAVVAVYLFCLLAYAVKLTLRPGVLAEDLRVLPGRAGVAAGILCLYLLAAAILPYSAGLARWVLFGALAAHLAGLVVLIWVFLRGPKEQRRVTPIWHLNFVGFILAGLSAPWLDMIWFAFALLLVTAVIAIVIWSISIDQLVRGLPPPPLRPLLAMHLAPAAMLGLVAEGIGFHSLALVFAILCAAILAVLVVFARWLTVAGFSPLWGAFTFPLAATASLWLAVGGVWATPGALALIAATLIVPSIAVKVLQLWAKGKLATATNAATA